MSSPGARGGAREDHPRPLLLAQGDIEGDDNCGTTQSPSYTCSENYDCEDRGGAARGPRAAPRAAPRPAPTGGIYTAVNATTATWTFATVKADGPGPADYSDALTVVQAHHGPRA